MKICEKCGKQLNDDAVFCEGCGVCFENNENCILNSEIEEQSGLKTVNASETCNFINGYEEAICSLGSGYFANMINNGSVSKVNATLTQKRVYFEGISLEGSVKRLTSVKQSKIVDIRDITGTSFVYTRRISFLIAGIISLLIACGMLAYNMVVPSYMHISLGIYDPFIIGFILFFVLYLLIKRSIFLIEYAGGSLGFDINWVKREEVIEFQKQIHIAKDKCIAETLEYVNKQ